MIDKKLKIAIIGYGKMGRAVEKIALTRKHDICLVIDNENDWERHAGKLKACDVAIELSTPETAEKNIRRCFEAQLPVVSGTTGWVNGLPEVSRMCRQKSCSLFYASNFSIGVNFFFELNKKLASMLSELDGYKTRIIETHHLEKLDAPSGTAITLANDIIAARRSLSGWGDADKQLQDNELPVKSYRIENITGTHVVCYESVIDSIEIKHTAHDRSGFAEGAVLAAQWIINKEGVFGMKDLLNI